MHFFFILYFIFLGYSLKVTPQIVSHLDRYIVFCFWIIFRKSRNYFLCHSSITFGYRG